MADTPHTGTPDSGTHAARTVYFDHAATSWPKAPGVADAMTHALAELGGNPGRGAYRMAVDTERAINGVRRDAAAFLGVAESKNLLFQPGCTQALNLALFGLIAAGDRVVACPTEHNAVARPLNVLSQRGVEVVLAEADDAGFVDLESVEALVAEAPTRAVVCQHAGNVTGAIQPVADLADIAHEHGALDDRRRRAGRRPPAGRSRDAVGRRLGVLGAQGAARPAGRGAALPRVRRVSPTSSSSAAPARVRASCRSAPSIAPTATRRVRPTCPGSWVWARR